MSKQDTKKNFELAAKFIHYTVKHPESVKGVGRRASIVVTDPKDTRLTEKNLALAQSLRDKRRVVYVAASHNGKWEVQRFRSEK